MIRRNIKIEKKITLLPVLTAGFMLFTGGCKEVVTTPQEEAAPALFDGTVKKLAATIDSLKSARDSASVDNLMANLLVNLTRLNFDYPANTDLELSEDENDSISKLTSRLLKLRDERLKSLSKDSVPSDSINKLLEKNLYHERKPNQYKEPSGDVRL